MKKHLFTCYLSIFFIITLLSSVKLDAQSTCSVFITSTTTQLDCNNFDAILTAQPTINGTPASSSLFSYIWNTNETTSSITVNFGGSYTVTVTEISTGCADQTTFNLIDYSTGHLVDIMASPDVIYCQGEVVYVEAMGYGTPGPFDYLWNTGETTPFIFVTAAGYYDVQVTDSSTGCIVWNTVEILEYPPVIAVITSTISELTCNQPFAIFDASASTGGNGMLTYNWSTGANTSTTTVTNSGNYAVTVTDAFGCTSTANYTLGEETQLPFSVINSSDFEITCATPIVTLDGSASISFNGTLTYLWSTGETTPMIEIFIPGTYSLEVTDEGGCSAMSFITITEDILEPTAAISVSSTEINALNPTVTLDATSSTGQGTLFYSWSTGAASSSIVVATPGIYEVTVTDDDNGCMSVSTIEITESMNDLYVDHTATGNNDGSSWADAFTDLQDAMAIGASAVIHVAEGTYYPTSGTMRGVAFEMPSSVTVLGGYPNGGGTRDLVNETILSGNIDGVASYAGNSYHVVSVKNVNNVILDGLIIRDGNADNANSFGRSRGGGLFVNNATVVLANVEVKWNKAIYGAGLFATLSPEVTINDCAFLKNRADYGSAIYHSNQTNLYMNRTRVVNNTADKRCAIEVNNSLYTSISNSVIANNASLNANAIAFIATNRDGSCDIYNTTILGETKNKFLITMQVGFGDVLDLNLYNSIIAHQVPTYLNAFKDFNNGVLNLNTTNCYIMGSSVIGNATNNLYSSLDGDLMLDTDYSLNPCSPGVDDGDDFYVSESIDIDGTVRIIGTVDMGAYENTSVCRLAGNDVETLDKETISVFPNPTKDIINIQTDIENPSFDVYNLVGKQILTTNENEINMTSLPQGIYLLSVMKGDELIKTIRIVKE